MEQFPSALSLNARAKLYARQARNMASSLDDDDQEDDEDAGAASDVDFVGHLLPLASADFDELDRQLDADYLKISKEWYASTGGKVGEDLEPEDLPVEDLSLRASAPGKGKSKSKKPAFYDVAFNYVAGFDMEAIARKAGLRGDVVEEEQEAESEEDEPMQAEEEKPTPVKSGWGFGLFGRK